MTSRFITLILALALTAGAVAAQNRPKLKPGDPQAKNLVAKKPPALTLEVATVTPLVTKVKRTSASTAGGGDQVVLRASSADPSIKPSRIAWATTGGKIIGAGQEVILDTTGLPAGAYHVTAQVFYAGLGICNGDCSAWDTKTVRVTECPPDIICFTSPVITVAPESSTVEACQSVAFKASEVSGGQGYGQVSYIWSSSAGKLTFDGTTARLDTCGVAPGTEIEVTVKATSEYANCEASGAARVLIPIPPPPAREMTPCTTFKRNNARVDNACKSVLQDSIRQLQADPLSRLVIDAYSNPGEAAGLALARGKNVRDRLADGSLGVTIDANRIIVRVAGVSNHDEQVNIWFLPEGAKMPAGGTEVNPGPVSSEQKHPDDELPAPAAKRKPRH